MTQRNLIAIDLAKTTFQVCLINNLGKLVFNKPMGRNQVHEFLVKQRPSIVAIEACSNMHYWGNFSKSHGHEVRAIPPKLVKAYLQGHKTDANDALAIAQAAQRPDLKVAPIKNDEQLELLQVNSVRDSLVQEKLSLNNRIRALLSEYGLVFRKGFAQLKTQVPDYLEDADNKLPGSIRSCLAMLMEKFYRVEAEVSEFDRLLSQKVRKQSACKRLTEIEGVGKVGATLLFAKLGDWEAFKDGREAAAYVGLTPKQLSSGGKVVMLGIGKKVGEQRLRSVMIQGAMSVISKLKEPTTEKQRWLFDLVQRAGKMRAAVALANKNVRTAWAMLKSGEAYLAK